MRIPGNRLLIALIGAYCIFLGIPGFRMERGDRHDEPIKVERTLAAWSSGALQRSIERLIGRGIARHAPFVRAYNQALWSVLRAAPAGKEYFVGRGGQIYLTFSVREYCGLYPPIRASESELRRFVADTGELARLLRDRGRAFIVVSAPSKPTFFPDDIPRYLCANGEAPNRVGRRFRAALESAGVPVVDGVALANDAGRDGTPVFAHHGAHWNPWAAHTTAERALRLVASELGDPEPRLLVSDFRLAPESPERTAERASLMDVYWGPHEGSMPVASFALEPNVSKRRATIVGDSFARALINIFVGVGAFESIEEFYYLTTSHTSHPSGVQRDNIERGDIDWDRDVFGSDIVILEITEGLGIPDHAWTFVGEALRRLGER